MQSLRLSPFIFDWILRVYSISNINVSENKYRNTLTYFVFFIIIYLRIHLFLKGDVSVRDKRTPEQIKWTKEVKKRIKKQIHDLDHLCGLVLNTKKLVNALEAGTPSIKTTVPTVEAIFDDTDDRRIPLDVLVGVCNILGINISDVLPQFERSKLSKSIWEPRSDTIYSGINALPDPFYEGEYFCYYFRPTNLAENVALHKSETETQPILCAKLIIKNRDGITKVDFYEKEEKLSFDGEKKMKELHLNGEAHLFIHMNQVHISLTDAEGLRYMNIMFPYLNLAKDILYYKTAAVFNVSTDPHRYPLFHKMALFRNELNLKDEENVDILRGILSMNSGDLLVEKYKFDALLAEDPLYAEFLRTEEPYYVFCEDMIYAQRTHMDYRQKVDHLMKLRNIATSSAIITVKEHERINVFMKDFQNQQKKEE